MSYYCCYFFLSRMDYILVVRSLGVGYLDPWSGPGPFSGPPDRFLVLGFHQKQLGFFTGLIRPLPSKNWF